MKSQCRGSRRTGGKYRDRDAGMKDVDARLDELAPGSPAVATDFPARSLASQTRPSTKYDPGHHRPEEGMST